MTLENKKNIPQADLWPSVPSDYDWKGTVAMTGGTISALAHCSKRNCDVFIRIKELDTDTEVDVDLLEITKNTRNLINLKHENLLTPVHSFHHKNDIWIVYPKSSGGPLSEILKSHYPNGLPNEQMVARILYDAACALNNLHQHQICHRNICATSLHIDRDTGLTLLTEFGVLKEIRFKYAKLRQNTMIPTNRFPWTDPLLLSDDPEATWFKGDVYSFGVTALELAFGEVPPSKVISSKQDLSVIGTYNYEPVGVDSYNKPCRFGKLFQALIHDCCAQKISATALVNHQFFKKCCDHLMIKNEIAHLVKSTESRVNRAFLVPPCFCVPDLETQLESNQKSVDFDFSTETLTIQKGDIKIDSNGNINSNKRTAIGLQNTTIEEKETYVNTNINTNLSADTVDDVDSNDESERQSQSQSQSEQEKILNAGRFNIEVLPGTNQYEYSLSSISEEQQNRIFGQDDPSVSYDETEAGPSTMYGRFAVAKGKNTPLPEDVDIDVIANNSNSNNNNNGQMQSRPTPPHVQPVQPVQVVQAPAQQLQPTPPVQQVEKASEKPQEPKDPKQWSVQDCSRWLASLGDAYLKYQEAFVSNGIDGAMMQEFDDEMLLEIVPSKLQRKKIIISAKALFPDPQDEGSSTNLIK